MRLAYLASFAPRTLAGLSAIAAPLFASLRPKAAVDLGAGTGAAISLTSRLHPSSWTSSAARAFPEGLTGVPRERQTPPVP